MKYILVKPSPCTWWSIFISLPWAFLHAGAKDAP